MSNVTNEQEALRILVTRATTDADFRAKLLRDPQLAIHEVIGRPISLRVKFIEKDPDVDLQVVLPDLIESAPELRQEELDSVAGGTNWCEFSCNGSTEE